MCSLSRCRAVLVTGCALLAGCGSSSSAGGGDAAPGPTVAPIAGKPITTTTFDAVRPRGFSDMTATAPANAANGTAPALQLIGPHTADGLKEIIRVDVIASSAVAELQDVENSTIAAARKRGDTIIDGPESTTAGGERAYDYQATFENTANGATGRRESVLVRSGTTDYAVIFVAAPSVFDRDLKVFEGFLGAIEFHD